MTAPMSGGGLLHRMTCHDNPYDSPYVMAALVTTRESQWQHMTAGAYMCAGGVNRRPVHDRAKAPVTCHVPVTRRRLAYDSMHMHMTACKSRRVHFSVTACNSFAYDSIVMLSYACTLWQLYDRTMTAYIYIYIYIYITGSRNTNEITILEATTNCTWA